MQCSDFTPRTFQKLLSHIKFIHSHEPNFSITCGDCGQTFRKFASFKTHIQREQRKKELARFNAPLEGNDGADNENDGYSEEEERDSDEDPEPENHVEQLTRFLALFILKTKETNQLTQQAINSILDNTEDLVESSLELLKKNVRSCLEDNGIHIEDVDGMKDVLEQPSDFSQAKESLSSEYLQIKYFVENFHLVVSISVL